jgi:hypothetical protein
LLLLPSAAVKGMKKGWVNGSGAVSGHVTCGP